MQRAALLGEECHEFFEDAETVEMEDVTSDEKGQDILAAVVAEDSPEGGCSRPDAIGRANRSDLR